MVGPRRPQFVLFGSSIVEASYVGEGWGAALAIQYTRKADVLVRGYRGWNSRQGLQVLNTVFPQDEVVQPSLVIVYFGGNDSVRPDPGSSHVPLCEYIENMRQIANHLKSLSKKSISEETRIIFLSTPPVNEEQMLEELGLDNRTNEECRRYSDACVTLCQEIGIKAIDLNAAFRRQEDWEAKSFIDGIHLSAYGSKIVRAEILGAIEEANWKPSLHWDSLPLDFGDIIPLEA